MSAMPSKTSANAIRVASRTAFPLVLALLFAAGAARAQHPNIDRGFAADKVYEMNGVDNVNLYNGNLMLSIPLGNEYGGNGNLRYRFTLMYNSKNWDYEPGNFGCTPRDEYCGKEFNKAIPTKISNAGMGWLLSMGRLVVRRDHEGVMRGSYQSPDGAEHGFPINDPADGNVAYAAEPPFMRLRDLGGVAGEYYGRWAVDFPDGSTHTFTQFGNEGPQLLTEIRDVFGNRVAVTNTWNQWTFEEYAAGSTTVIRTHKVRFRDVSNDPELEPQNAPDNYKMLVSEVEVAAPAGTAVYKFEYQGQVVPYGCYGQSINPTETRNDTPDSRVARLTRVVLEDEGVVKSEWRMEYYQTNDGTKSMCSNISRLVLPTRGTFEWTYGSYLMPTASCDDALTGPADLHAPYAASEGVFTKKVTDPVTGTAGTWSYTPELDSEGAFVPCWGSVSVRKARWSRVTVARPDASRSEYFFSLFPWGEEQKFQGEYALPFTRNAGTGTDGKCEEATDLCLSSIEYDCSAGSCMKKRSRFVRYEGEHRTGFYGPDRPQYRREVASRTVFHDDANQYKETKREGYDGFGNFRRVSNSASWGEGSKSEYTNFNPGKPSIDVDPVTWANTPAITRPLPGDRWLLSLFDYQSAADGSGADVKLSEVCWDANGFMKRKRMFRGLDNVADFLTVREPDAQGNLKTESHHSITTASTCGAAPGTALVTINNTWSHGSLATSQHAGASFKSVDRDIDAASGLTRVSRDAKGRITNFGYDLLGRLKKVTPPGEAPTEYQYLTTEEPAHVVARQMDSASGTVAAESHFYYDGYGRLIQEKRRMPAGWSTVTHTYDAAGRKTGVTVPVYEETPAYSGDSLQARTKYTYDAFGRTTKTDAPDDSTVEVRYTGDREMSRGVRIATTPGDITNQTRCWTTEIYDGLGRMSEVLEPLPACSDDLTVPRVSTKYSYDFLDRLIEVTNGQTPRKFQYDRAGLLRSDSHPERSAGTYTYDARGRLLTKQIGTTVSLLHGYDAAERLTHVTDQTTGKVLKEFKFDSEGVVTEPGRLVRQTRYNYFPDTTYTVTDRFAYAATTGRLATKETDVTTPTGVTRTSQSYAYDVFGQPASIQYPKCVQCGTFPLPERTLALTWSNGVLRGIAGAATSIDYAPTGAATKIVRASNAVDDYLQDPSGMARPARITFSNVLDCALILSQPSSVNISEGGVATFTIGTVPGATVQWYQGTSGFTGAPIPGAVQATYTTPSLTTTKAYWARVTAPGGGCQEDGQTAVAAVCKAPVVTPPAATTARREFTGVPLTFAVTVAEAASYEWFWRPVGTSARNGIAGAVAQITYSPAATEAGKTIEIVVEVRPHCDPAKSVQHTVAVLEIVNAAQCKAEFDPVHTSVFTWNYTIMPNEHTDERARLRMTAADADTSWPKRRYSFRWYQDGVLQKSADLIWKKGVVTEPDPVSSAYLWRFVDQSHLRLEAWVSCYNSLTADELSPAAVSDRVTRQSFGVMNGHCPTPDLTVNPMSVVKPASGAVVLKAETVYPDARFQWYEGESGNTANEAHNGKTSTLTVSDVGTYWVRVSSECGKYRDSGTITVSAASCAPVRILRDPAGTSVKAGTPVTLSVDVVGIPSPSYYLWSTAYNGPGVGTDVNVEGSNGKQAITVVPLETTDYYARVGNGINYRNDCSLIDSRIARVRVTSCADIDILSPPADVVLRAQDTSVLMTIQASAATALKYQWFMGESGDMSRPVDPVIGSGPSLQLTWLDHLQDPAANKFWVKVSFPTAPGMPKRCAVDSRTVNVCRLPRVHNPIGPYSNSAPGVRRVLEVGVTGDGLTYQWFEGDGESRPLNSTSDAVAVHPLKTTKYWVKIRSACAAPTEFITQTSEVSVCPAFDGAPTADKTLVSPNVRTTLHADVDRGDRIEWYTLSATGSATLVPAMTGPDPLTPPITATTRFFARAWSGICHRDSEPVTISLCDGPNVSFSNPTLMLVQKGARQTLTATRGASDPALEWQWYRGTEAGNLAASTPVTSSPTFDIYPTETQSLWVRGTATATGCFDDSSVLTLKVCVPTIVEQPKAVMVDPNTSATLKVVTDNLPGVTYQWYSGPRGDITNKVIGQTTNVLTITPTADTTYWVRVSGCDNTKYQDSDAAAVSICKVPQISEQPQHRELAATGSAEIKVVASGTDLTYQWFKGPSGDTTVPIPDATTPTRTQNPAATTKYWVRITGRCGTINSAAATLARPAIIQTEPAGKAITKGTATQLSVVASGNELTYQWYQRTATGIVVMNGATSATFTTPAINSDATFFCRVSSGSTTTAIARKDSADATVTVCLPNAFTATAYGAESESLVVLKIDAPVAGETYQWYRGASGETASLAGTGAQLNVYPLETTSYWVRTTRGSCTADSAAKTVQVCRPKVTAQPASVTIPAGTSTTMSVAATGTGPLTYQWFTGPYGDTSNPVSTASSFPTGPLTATTNYWARITSSSSCSTRHTDSAIATVTVCQPPVIVEQDKEKYVPYNYRATIKVTATGDNLHYQWYEGLVGDVSKPIGVDSNEYTWTTSTTLSYWVRITGSCGPPVDSQQMRISVEPHILTPPASTTVCGVGGTATFTVNAWNVEKYQWYRQYSGQSAEMVGGNSPKLEIPVSQIPVQFWVVLTSGIARTTSAKVSVTAINPVPTITNFVATAIPNSTKYQLKAEVKSSDAGLVKYRFYQGPLGDTTTLINDVGYNTINVTPPSKPITYWVRVYYIDTGCSTDRALTIQ